jgi:phosphonate transport system substrate-binding protein
MTTLRLASCMAENTEALCRAVAQYLGERLKIATEYVTGIPWQEREARFDRGEIQVLWLCGLPYVNKADLAGNGMELLAVPVPLGARYQGRAVYFSDVVVRRQSRFERFADLRGAAWAYNEPRSHSGFNVVRAHLSELGEGRGFFTSAVEAGAHARALELVLAGAVDGAAIDSLVLEGFAARWPEVMAKLRVIETLGPSPIPPWVVSSRGQTNCAGKYANCCSKWTPTLAGGRCSPRVGSPDSAPPEIPTTNPYGSWRARPSESCWLNHM